MIRFENYSEEKPILESGLPQTTKKDDSYHGFGLKSIHMIAQKYGGSMTVTTENNWFILRILIPMPMK
jgi:sensor histidine kinase regulating citrate/malate metabolism